MKTKRLAAHILMLGTATLLLGGCANMNLGKASATNNTKSDAVSGAIAAAARDAASEGRTKQSLIFQERLYQNDPRNEEYILAYARGLRHAGRVDDAKLVIRTPAKSPKASGPLLTECALVLISGAEYDEGLGFAQKALEKSPNSPDAHQALALALSGLEKYSDAQLQFQTALDLWPETRDRTSIINNLAMSLAAQGKVSEARTVMSLATGEALQSRTYQNNRALLDTLKDREVVAEKIPEKIISDVKLDAPDANPQPTSQPDMIIWEQTPEKPSGKMLPIIE